MILNNVCHSQCTNVLSNILAVVAKYCKKVVLTKHYSCDCR